MAKEAPVRLVRPLLTALQVLAPSVLLKTPPPKVPTYKIFALLGSTTIELTEVLVRPVLLGTNQLLPPLTLLNTPGTPGVPTYMICGFVTLMTTLLLKVVVSPVLLGVQLLPPLEVR